MAPRAHPASHIVSGPTALTISKASPLALQKRLEIFLSCGQHPRWILFNESVTVTCFGLVATTSWPGPSSEIGGFWAAEQREVPLPAVSQHLSAEESFIRTVYAVPKY